jgi:hypothetical protein
MMLDIQSAHRSERREQLKSTHRNWTPEAVTLPRLNLRNNTLQPGWRGAVQLHRAKIDVEILRTEEQSRQSRFTALLALHYMSQSVSCMSLRRRITLTW